jgi:hypothetical protein
MKRTRTQSGLGGVAMAMEPTEMRERRRIWGGKRRAKVIATNIIREKGNLKNVGSH